MPLRDQGRPGSSNATPAPSRPTVPIAPRRARLACSDPAPGLTRGSSSTPPRPASGGIGGQGVGGAGSGEFVPTGQGVRRQEPAPFGAVPVVPRDSAATAVTHDRASGNLQRVYTLRTHLRRRPGWRWQPQFLAAGLHRSPQRAQTSAIPDAGCSARCTGWAGGRIVQCGRRHTRSDDGGGAHWLEAEDRLAQGTFDRRVDDIGPLAPQAGPGFTGGLAACAIERGWAAGSLMSGTKRTAPTSARAS